MAPAVADTARLRDAARWWERLPARREALEGVGLLEDRTITRLSPQEIDGNVDLRAMTSALEVEPGDLLTYLAYAEGGFGRYRLAAIFPLPPGAMEPLVLCLDGPRGLAASEHRFDDVRLCLYFKNDPPERQWKPDDGLRRLFDLARRHVTGEYLARELGAWPIEEAPHGETAPALRDPALALPQLKRPGRNEPCTCGSGRKSKRCCWR